MIRLIISEIGTDCRCASCRSHSYCSAESVNTYCLRFMCLVYYRINLIAILYLYVDNLAGLHNKSLWGQELCPKIMPVYFDMGSYPGAPARIPLQARPRALPGSCCGRGGLVVPVVSCPDGQW